MRLLFATIAAVLSPAVDTASAAEPGAQRGITREAMLAEVAAGWERRLPRGEPASGVEEFDPTAALRAKLEAIVLPDLSFTGADISEVVRVLGAATEELDPSAGSDRGVNLVLIDPAGGRAMVTIALRRVTLKRALDLITQSIGYEYEVQSDAVLVRPLEGPATLPTAFFPISRGTALRIAGAFPAGPAGARGGDGGLAGSEAERMRGFLQQAGVSFEREGTALAYDGSALIVTQTPGNLARIRNILARYREVRQVEIEAKFMEVQEGALEELGVQWRVTRRGIPQTDPATGAPILDHNGRQVFVPQETYTTAGVTRSLAGAFPSATTNPAITIDSAGTPATVIDGVNIPGVAPESRVIPVPPPVIPGSVSLGTGAGPLGTISGFVGEFDVNAVVRALAQQQGTDLLSSPRITVLSGNPASITVAQELRFPQSYGEIQSQVGSGSGLGTGISAAGVTITSGTPQEFTTRNVGVELNVTPVVEDDDYSISLDLNPKVTEFEGFVEYGGPSIAISSGVTVKVPPGFYQPIFSVRDIATRVTIWDGATLVMGGLTREEVKQVDDKVPFLGDIPVVGRLFRTKAESAQKRNLLIFVTANLVDPGGGRKGRGKVTGDR